MLIFDRSLTDYWRFTRSFLAILTIVFFLKLTLHALGASTTVVRLLSLEVTGIAYTAYFAIAVEARKFGSYPHLLFIVFLGEALRQGLVTAAILVTVCTGKMNIYSIPEYSPAGYSQWGHILGHLIIGLGAGTLVSWGVACLILFLWRRMVVNSQKVL